MKRFEFTVMGSPATQGSMRAFVNRKTGKAVVVHATSGKLRKWRRQVRAEAELASTGVHPIEGPCDVDIVFILSKPQRPRWTDPAARPDIDKLARAMLDAFTGVLFKDDAQVVRLNLRKAYSETTTPGPRVVCAVAESVPDDLSFVG